MSRPKSGFISEDEPGAFMATVTFDHPHYSLVAGPPGVGNYMKPDPEGDWIYLEEWGSAHKACASLESAEAFIRFHFERANVPCPPMVEGYNEGTWTIWPSNWEVKARAEGNA